MGVSIEVGAVPGRKSKAIGILDGTIYHVVAYFRDEESYERFVKATHGANTLRFIDEEDA